MWPQSHLLMLLFCAIISAHPPVAKLDIAADSDSEGRGFESLRAGHMKTPLKYELLSSSSMVF